MKNIKIMNFIILSKSNKSVSQKEFIDFWDALYEDSYEEKSGNKYSDNINQSEHSKQTLLALFEWKNRSKMSAKKTRSFNENILSKLKIINKLRNDPNFNEDIFLKEFNTVSTIWKIFLLHIIKPNKYPIFDQHVYRAFCYINHQGVCELPLNNQEREKKYFDEYLPFFQQIKEGFSIKKTDEALWTFGKFLKSNFKKIID